MANLSFKADYGKAQLDDVQLHYATIGSSDKLVILLHGFPEFWYSWRNQLEFLSRDFTVVAPDLRGYNLSDKPKRVEDYQINKLVSDVVELIQYFKREKAIIVGHDWGAIIAWATALKFPERVEKLVAMQVPPPAAWRANFTVKQLFASWYVFFFQIPQLPELLLSASNNKLLKHLLNSLAAHAIFTDEDFGQYKKSWNQPSCLKAGINYYRANLFQSLFTKNSAIPTSKVKVPTLFIYGEREKAIVAETVRDIRRFVDAPYFEVRIPNAGHWVQQEAASEVNQALQQFLNSS